MIAPAQPFQRDFSFCRDWRDGTLPAAKNAELVVDLHDGNPPKVKFPKAAPEQVSEDLPPSGRVEPAPAQSTVAGFIKDLITAKFEEYKTLFGTRPDRLYVGKNQLTELMSVVKDTGQWQPDSILGMEVFLVKENNHLYLAGGEA